MTGWWAGLSAALAAYAVASTAAAVFVYHRSRRERARMARQSSEVADESSSRSEFLANVSHDMRTPLHGVIGMLDLALDDEMSPSRMRQLQAAKRSAESLLGTVDDILDLAKIEARKITLEPVYFSLRELLAETLKPLGVTAAAKKLDLAYSVDADVPDNLWGDPVRVRQLLTNLVGNAIKFTRRGEVALRVTRDRGENVHFGVADTGVGIPESKQRLIFEPYTQLDVASSRRLGGAGLGLAIVARLVHMMGGTIQVASSPEHGSIFSVNLPLATDLVGSAPLREPWERALDALDVLVVDANETSRHFVEQVLWARGANVSVFATPDEAPDRRFACTIATGPVRRVDPDVTILPALATDRSLISVTRPVGEKELLLAVGTALGIVPRRAPVEAAPSRRQRALWILVAEDHAVGQEFAVEALRRLGHTVSLAADGGEALARIERDRFDLALLDIQMPVLDGLTVAKMVRERESLTGSHLPIIALTAYTSREDHERCLAAGMDAVVTKPVDRRRLAEVIRDVTGAESIAAVAGGDRDLLARVSDAFSRQTPALLETLRSALERGDSAELARSAHKLKGAVSNFDGDPSFAIAERLESAARASDIEAAQPLLDELAVAVDRLQRRLEEAVR